MARSPERSPRAHADPDHIGRHRRVRLARAGDAAGGVASVATADEHGTEDGDDPDQDAPVQGQDRPDDTPDPTASAVVPLFSVPDSLRSVDLAVGGRAVRGLLLVAVVLLLTLGGRWWWVNQQAAGVPVEQVAGPSVTTTDGAGPGGTVTDGAGPDGTVTDGADPGPSGAEGDRAAPPGEGADRQGAERPGEEGSVVVHVIGHVHEPGVVRLPAGSRVIDAVRAAGGITDEADPASLNLARPVVDGEQVWVGAPGEEPPPGVGPGVPGSGSGGVGSSPGTGPSGAAGQGDPVLVVDLNLAGQAELEELPGVGPVTAGNILAWREQHGRFTVVEELMEVSGIGEKTFEQLRPHVTVGG